MLRLVIRRLLISVPLVFIVSALTFVLLAFVPGDAALAFFGGTGTPQELAALRHRLGLDLPVWEQYGNWLAAALHGSLGTSMFGNGDVVPALNARLPVTVSLVVGAVLTSAVFGIALGVASAVRGGALGKAIDVLSVTTFGIPNFWLSALLVAGLAVAVRIFPATGYVDPSNSVVEWARSLVLPVTALSLHGVAVVAKQTRDSMLDVLGRDFIRNLRAAGIGERSIIWKHALRNASIPVVTVLGLMFVGLFGGTVTVETVFALPGIGSLAVLATQRHDIPIVQGVAIYFTLVVIAVNLLLDVVYGWLNPKVHVA